MHSTAKVCFFNKSQMNNGTYINDHSHNCYEIVYYLSGMGKSSINEKEYNFSENHIAVIKPFVKHNEHYYADGVIIFIGFEYDNSIIEISEGIFFTNNHSSILSIVNDIMLEISEQKIGYELILSSKINELVVNLARINAGNNQNCKDLSYVVNFINENYSQKINFKELASICGYSYDYFRHIFKNKTNLSPQDYLIHTRLDNSKELLINSDLDCTHISYMCGFANSAQFSVMFKRQYNQGPKMFQMKNAKSNVSTGTPPT